TSAEPGTDDGDLQIRSLQSLRLSPQSPRSVERAQMTAMTRDDGDVGDLPFLRLSYKDDANPLPGSSRRCRRYALGEQHLLRADHCGVHAPAEPSADDPRPGPAIFEPGRTRNHFGTRLRLT